MDTIHRFRVSPQKGRHLHWPGKQNQSTPQLKGSKPQPLPVKYWLQFLCRSHLQYLSKILHKETNYIIVHLSINKTPSSQDEVLNRANNQASVYILSRPANSLSLSRPKQLGYSSRARKNSPPPHHLGCRSRQVWTAISVTPKQSSVALL